jgi:hypothetical protein
VISIVDAGRCTIRAADGLKQYNLQHLLIQITTRHWCTNMLRLHRQQKLVQLLPESLKLHTVILMLLHALQVPCCAWSVCDIARTPVEVRMHMYAYVVKVVASCQIVTLSTIGKCKTMCVINYMYVCMPIVRLSGQS